MEKDIDYLKLGADPDIQNFFENNEKLEFSAIVNKFNSSGWNQKRTLVITNKSIYNIKKKSLKRKILIPVIGAIIFSTDPKSLEFVIHVPTEYDYRYSCE